MELVGALGAAVVGVGVGAVFAMPVVVVRGLPRKATRRQNEIAAAV
ncbi:hypothetical protein ACFVGX_26305 [Streptomyces sp. NPDC127113]